MFHLFFSTRCPACTYTAAAEHKIRTATAERMCEPRLRSAAADSAAWDRQRFVVLEDTHRFVAHELGECI